MNNETRLLYDKLVYVGIANIFTLSKENKSFNLKFFDYKNEAHLAVLHMALSVKELFNFEIKLEIPLFEYLYFKNKYKVPIKKLKKSEKGISCNKFIDDIEIPNDAIGTFKDIYINYYRRIL